MSSVTKLIASYSIIFGCHIGILFEFGVVASCTAITSGFRRVDLRFFRVGVAIGAVVPGVLVSVAQRCICGFVARTRGMVGLVIALTGGAAAFTFCWLGFSPSVTTFCGGCMSISKVDNDFMIYILEALSPLLWQRRDGLPELIVYCLNMLHWIERRKEAVLRNKPKDPEIWWLPVSWTHTFMLP